MSEEKPPVPPAPPEPEKKEDKFVPADAYQSLQEKAGKTSSENAQLKARLAQLEADRKAQEEKEMAEKQQFEQLWQKEKEEKEALAQRLEQNDSLYKQSVKKSFLKQALGGQIKDQYLDFADIDKIEIDESGRPTEDSLNAVAEKFREEHGQLIPKASGNDPNAVAAGSGPGTGRKPDAQMKEIMTDRYAFHEYMKNILKNQ